MNGVSASKSVALSKINVHYLLHFLGEMFLIFVVVISIQNIINLITDNMAE